MHPIWLLRWLKPELLSNVPLALGALHRQKHKSDAPEDRSIALTFKITGPFRNSLKGESPLFFLQFGKRCFYRGRTA